MVNRRRIATFTGHTTIALSIGCPLCLAVYTLGPATYHRQLDVPMALCFWSYLVLTPVAGLLCVGLGERCAALQRFVSCLVGLWGLVFVTLLLMPFAL
jgi:hypothetical protein